jgi:hypothetical protein
MLLHFKHRRHSMHNRSRGALVVVNLALTLVGCASEVGPAASCPHSAIRYVETFTPSDPGCPRSQWPLTGVVLPGTDECSVAVTSTDGTPFTMGISDDASEALGSVTVKVAGRPGTCTYAVKATASR